MNSERNTSTDIALWLQCWFCPFEEECKDKLSSFPAGNKICAYFVDKYVDTPDKK